MILFEVLLIQIEKEIYHFAGWNGGSVRGTRTVLRTESMWTNS